MFRKNNFFRTHFRFFKNFWPKVFKKLTFPKYSSSGRNHHGKITCYHRTSNRIFSRVVPLDQSRIFFFFSVGIVCKSNYLNYHKFYDLVIYDNGHINFFTCIEGVHQGDVICNTYLDIFFSLGSVVRLGAIFYGLPINTICFSKIFANNFSTAPGTSSKILKSFSNNLSLVELASGEKRIVSKHQCVVLGRVSSLNFLKKKIKKAGDYVKLGFRPVVRGVAMNPIDHPHGGGQGKTSGGQPSVSPWGIYSKGSKTSTRIKRRTFNFYKKF